MNCLLCGEVCDALIRLNKVGEAGLFACTRCRPKFDRYYQNTDDVLTKRDELRRVWR